MGSANLTYTFHVHSTASTNETATTNSQAAMNSYPASAASSTTSGGCYTEKHWSATKNVRYYHPEQPAQYGNCTGQRVYVITGHPVKNGVEILEFNNGYWYCKNGQCGDTSYHYFSNLPLSQAGGTSSPTTCGKQYVTQAATPAYWDDPGTNSSVSGTGNAPGNSNDGNVAITYSNVSYYYTPNCGKSDKQLVNVVINF